MQGAVQKAEELAKETENSFIPGQFDNPANPRAHYSTTGPEIYETLDGDADIFVAGVGTGGTITGVGRYLKEKNPDTSVVAIEPFSSPLLSEGKAGPHGLQGIGANFVPSILDTDIYDEIITVKEEDAYGEGPLSRFSGRFFSGHNIGGCYSRGSHFSSSPRKQGEKYSGVSA